MVKEPKISQIFKYIIGLILFVCFEINSNAQILTFEFSALAGDEASATSNYNDANITSSTISRGAGLTASANSGRFNATNWALTSIANAVSGNNYMQFTITPNASYQFSVSSIVVQLQRSATGNTAIALRSSVDGYTANLDAIKTVTDNTSTQTFTFTFVQANSSTPVTYRLYSYAEAAGGSGGPGDGTGNDIVVNGTVTPTAACSDPTTQASSVTFSSVGCNSMTVGWTRGGTPGDGVIVVGKAGGVPTDPSDGTNYTANAAFGSGTDCGSGSYVVFMGSGTSVNVTGLSASTTYYFEVFEKNCTGTSIKINTTSPASGNQSSLPLPSVPTGTITPAANPSCGPTTLTYSGASANIYWQTSSTGTSTTIPTTSAYSVTTSGTYYVRAYNGSCWSTNSLASPAITINTAPSISTQPSNQSVVAPATATFSVTAAGTGLGYQWQINTGSGWTNISGATSSSYTTGATNSSMNGYEYRCVVSGTAPCTPVTSGTATLSISVINAWINEIHYDNDGTDAGEKIEVVIENPGSFTLSSFRIDLYNGGDGASYANQTINNFTVGATSGNATIYTWAYSGIQNGSPDGLALSYNGTLIQFLSYEGTFTGSSGVASGVTSTDIGVAESGTSIVGYSLQLNGDGCLYSDFTWSESAPNTMGAVNYNQTLCEVCIEPTTNPVDLVFSNITNTTIDFSIGAAGNGSKRVIFAKEGSAVDYVPVDNTTYYANDFYASTDYSGNRAVYVGLGTSGTITGLTPGTTYYFKVFEFNCVAGSEDYFLGGVILSGSQTTMISPVTGLEVSCQTSTTATISWVSPEGAYDGVVIGMRNSTLDCHSIGSSDNESVYTASSVFGSGHQYGATTPYSFVVYKGTGTSVTVTGLTVGQSYSIMAYTFKNSTTWSAIFPTASITSLGVPNVTSLSATPLDAQVQVSWSSPLSTCYDEIMVIAKQTTAVTSVPTGDGTGYTPNATFGAGTGFDGGFVVYKGTGNSVTVTGLTNGTQYCFKVFTRSGTTWSSGVTTCQTPIAGITVFVPGSIVVVGVCSNVDACLSPPDYAAGDDEISIICFNNLSTGSTFDMTDNGWNRCTTGKWGNAEGYLRIRRTGADIPAGTVITFRLTQSAPYFEGVYPDNDWAVDIRYGSLILNTNGDQIYFMTGGTWNNGTTNNNDATYTGGVVLFGFNTNDDWVSGVCSSTLFPPSSTGTGASQNSGLYNNLECFNLMPLVATDYLKFNLPLLDPLYNGTTTLTQREWIELIKDEDNWIAYTDCDDYYNNADNDFSGNDTLIHIASTGGLSVIPGLWTGAVSEDWFYCGNWDNMIVPDNTVDVYLGNTASTTVTNNCVIGAPGIAGAPSENFTEASCRNLTNELSGYVFRINNALSKLDIWGNYTTNSTFSHTAGLVTFKGTTAQTHTGVATFYNLTLNNSAGLTLNNNINIASGGTLRLTSGILTTQSSNTIDLGTGGTIVEATPSVLAPVSYVTGNVKATRNIGSGVNQTFGGMGIEINEPGASNSTLVTRVTGTSVIANGNSSIKRYFDIEPTTNAGLNSTFVLHYFDHEIIGFSPEASLIMFKSPSPYVTWTNQGGVINTASNLSTKTAIPSFSRWTLALSSAPLPVNLLSFKAIKANYHVELYWATLSEINNDYFNVERSRDGQWFGSIDAVQGAGNSNQQINYRSFDLNPYPGLSYYRLKQVDFDGNFSYSETIPVEFTVENEMGISNLASTGSTVSFEATCTAGNMMNINVIDMTGKVLYRSDSKSEGVTQFIINTAGYTPGVYCVLISCAEETTSEKFVIH